MGFVLERRGGGRGREVGEWRFYGGKCGNGVSIDKSFGIRVLWVVKYGFDM